MPYSTFTGNGTNDTFAVPFDYLLKSHVNVTVDGTSVPFTWPTTGTVRLATPPANGSSVVVSRTTPIDQLLSTFPPGNLRGSDLERAFNQLLFALQERS